jgi:hypothetical protein
MNGISCVTEQLLSCGKQRGLNALIDLVKRKIFKVQIVFQLPLCKKDD